MAGTILAVSAGKELRSELFPHTEALLGGRLFGSGVPPRLRGTVGSQNNLLSEHAHAGDILRLGVIALALVLAVTVCSELIRAGRPTRWAAVDSALDRKTTAYLLRGALLLLSVFCGFMVVRTGHLGAKLVWADRVGVGGRHGAGVQSGEASPPLFGTQSSSGSSGSEGGRTGGYVPRGAPGPP
jgi:hypothetical protein